MSYRKGQQIDSIAEFDSSDTDMFLISYYKWPKHRRFLESWQYSLLKKFIQNGLVFEAIKEETK